MSFPPGKPDQPESYCSPVAFSTAHRTDTTSPVVVGTEQMACRFGYMQHRNPATIQPFRRIPIRLSAFQETFSAPVWFQRIGTAEGMHGLRDARGDGKGVGEGKSG